jgi:glycerophosphoryl diester phosphodiesterase
MTRIIAHRGASATHPENTVAAFRAAREQGADGVELDVRLTAGDVLVVYHDARLPDGRAIRDVGVDDLPESIPTLVEALESLGDLWVNVEIKNAPGEPGYDDRHLISVAVAGLLVAQAAAFDPGDGSASEHGRADRVLVSSFNVDSLSRLRKADAGLPLGLLVWGQANPASLVARAEAHGYQAIHPHDLLVDQLFVERAHDSGLDVNVWTVNDADRLRQLAEWGVDGVITDDPVDARAALGRG